MGLALMLKLMDVREASFLVSKANSLVREASKLSTYSTLIMICSRGTKHGFMSTPFQSTYRAIFLQWISERPQEWDKLQW